MGSAVGFKDISDLWLNHYSTLFSSVSYNEDVIHNIIASVTLPDRCDIKDVTGTEVYEILSSMANNKAGDYYGRWFVL